MQDAITTILKEEKEEKEVLVQQRVLSLPDTSIF